MKNTIKNITFAACLVATCAIHGAATATVACVKSSGTSSSNAEYAIEWSHNDEYGGIAACTDTEQGQTVDRLNIVSGTRLQQTCYCKMLWPRVSKWEMGADGWTAGYICTSSCASSCAGITADAYTFLE